MTIFAILLLAAGTYALRAAGPALAGRIEPSARVRWLLSVAAAVLLCALVATSALTSGPGFAGTPPTSRMSAPSATAACTRSRAAPSSQVTPGR